MTNMWIDLDAILVEYYGECSDANFQRTVAKLKPYMDLLMDWYDIYHQRADKPQVMIMVGSILSNYVSVLGAVKELCLMRDGSISSHIRAHNVLLERIHAFNEDFSIELMVEWPKAYIGIDGDWVIPAKLCL